MVRQHHQLNRHESEQTPGNSGGHRNLACYSPLGHKALGMTRWPSSNNIYCVGDHILSICSSFDGHAACFQTLGHCEQCYANVHARYLSESLFQDLSGVHLGGDLLVKW